jgi:Sec-independent protein translocase protein TatA
VVFDLSLPKLLVLAVIALVVFGPDELRMIAAQAGRALRDLRQIAEAAKNDLREGLGPEFAGFEIEDAGGSHGAAAGPEERPARHVHRTRQSGPVISLEKTRTPSAGIRLNWRRYQNGRELRPRRRLACCRDGRGAGGLGLLLRCVLWHRPPASARFWVTVKMDPKIAATVAAIG